MKAILKRLSGEVLGEVEAKTMAGVQSQAAKLLDKQTDEIRKEEFYELTYERGHKETFQHTSL